MTDVVQAVREERQALIDLLVTLSPEQWANPSLCAGWRVQDVAAHLAWASALSLPEAARELFRAGFRPNRLIADTAVRWSERGPQAIVDQLRTNLVRDTKPAGMPWEAGLLDAVVHGLDIRRPLGEVRPLPGPTFRRVADFGASARWPTSAVLGGSAARRVAGVRLVATDQDWASGEGAEVRGTGDALLLLLTGRPVRPGELSGPGAATLEGRLAG